MTPLKSIFKTLLVLFLSLVIAPPLLAQTPEHPAYVGSEVCADCHTDETEAWRGSHHALAWTEATESNILGDFDDTTFSLNGIDTRFFKEGDTHFIETDGPDGTLTTYPVHSVAGIEPLQQYLLETEPGRLQSFDVVWDTELELWLHLYPEDELYADNGLHWTGPYKTWNARCAECHATNFRKSYDAQTRAYTSTQTEIGVGCEACHGPGEAHVAWARDPGMTTAAWHGLTETGLTIDMAAGGETYIQQCASCHALREPFEDGSPLPGTGFHDAYRLNTLRPGSYHPDGQILQEVYVYGSFLQSKMYAEGVTCNNCHEPHSAQLRLEGNAICTQCHSEVGNDAFPTLTQKLYDDPSHHFHAQGSAGAECKSCHMIERNYMVVDGRRDHSFRIPRPDLRVSSQSPNACTDCHSDQSASWAAQAIETWHPNSTQRGPHYGETLALAQRDPVAAVEALISLIEEEKTPAIVRAAALDSIAQVTTPDLATGLAATLTDASPLVRASAIAVQRGAGDAARIARLAPLLDDPVKSVRIAAAREFLALPPPPANQQEAGRALAQAMSDWQSALNAKLDFPEVQMVLGGVGLTLRRMGVALRAFEEATDLDPQLVQAWIMRIRIHAALGDRDSALQTANLALAANPESTELSLLRAELAE